MLERAAERLTRKVLTTPQRPEEGVLTGMRLVLADAGLGFADIAIFVHGNHARHQRHHRAAGRADGARGRR
ncbi:MAG: hypothetical protein WDN49_11660 [Acetobacteraceae bacterium]